VLAGNPRGGFVFAAPLPPLGLLLTGNQFPLSLSPDAVLAYVASSVNPAGRPPQTGALFRWEEIARIDCAGKKICINGQLLLKVSSTVFAEHIATELRTLSKLTREKRGPAIERLLQESLDTRAVEKRWQEFEPQVASVRWVANLLFALLFIAAPGLIWNFGLSRCWPWLLAGVLACTITTALLFKRVHRRAFPLAEDERFTHFLIVLLSPASTLRAHDLLTRPLLEKYHPLAIAKLFLSPAALEEFSRSILQEICYPARPVCPNNEPIALSAEQHSRAALRKIVEAFLKRNGLEPATLLRPPSPADPTCCSYCPRCLMQFTVKDGECADCGGLPLLALTGPSRASSEEIAVRRSSGAKSQSRRRRD
jgi:hypothetical protein